MSGIELQGVDQLLAQIRQKLGAAATRMENRGLRKAGEPIAEAMRDRVELSKNRYVIARHVKEDIRVSRVVRREGRKYVLIGTTRKTSWRAKFLEYGTSKMPAIPFVEPGFNEKKDEALHTLVDEFRKGLRE